MKILSGIKNFLHKHLSSPLFYSDGDWLIWRCTPLSGEFDMSLCAKLIRLEKRNLSTDDVERILARYKEHVSFWDIGLETIRKELKLLAEAVKRDKDFIFDMFDELEAKRIRMKRST